MNNNNNNDHHHHHHDHQPNHQRPWVEKYRPKQLNNISHQNEIISTLQNAVKTNRLPHLLFYGPPGTGKTSVALALCSTLYSPSQLKLRILELNASDERGISMVRDKIKHFASLSVSSSSFNNNNHNKKNKKNFNNKKKRSLFETTTTTTMTTTTTNDKDDKDDDDEMDIDHGTRTTTTTTTTTTDHNNNNNNDDDNDDDDDDDSYPNPPYKIIILDEADTMTADAQAALRRIIEAFSRITRFILICNYVTRIIEPLSSRCAKFRFQSLPSSSMKMRLQDICQKENCKLSSSIIDTIMNVSNGDMRKAITTLQSANALNNNNYTNDGDGGDDDNSITTNNNGSSIITKDDICEIVGLPPPQIMETLFYTNLMQESFDVMNQAIENILAEGYAAQQILLSLLPMITATTATTSNNNNNNNNNILPELSKANIAIKIAQAEHSIQQGGDEYLQLLTVGSCIVQEYIQSKKKQNKTKQTNNN